MLDQFSEVIYFAKGVVRNKWIIIIVAWLVCLSGWAYVYKMPNIYRSSSRVHVDTRTMLRPLLRGMAIQSNVRGLVLIMRKLMFTRNNMLKVAELAGRNIDLEENQIHSLVQELKGKVKINGGRDEIFTITSESRSPVDAKKMVQAVLTVFSEQTQQSCLGDVESAERFIDNQIKEYEQRLRNAEKAKENFKRENIGMLPGQPGEGQFGQIQSLRHQLEEAKTQLSELNSRKTILHEQLDEALDSGDEWGLTDMSGPEASGNSRITALINSRNELLIRYTENHPKITSIDNLIKSIQKQNEENELLNSGGDEQIQSNKAMANPYVQSIKMGINQIDIEIATINSRIRTFETKLKEEDEQFNARLAIETEMQNLNRDYSTIKKNYMALLDRRETAQMSQKIDTQVAALKFKVIDPANLPTEPSSPKRKLFYSMTLIAGYLLGVALALVKVFFRPSFAEAKQLRDITGIPVLGVVSEVVNEVQAKNNSYRLVSFLAANLVLLVGYSGVMLSDFYIDLFHNLI